MLSSAFVTSWIVSSQIFSEILPSFAQLGSPKPTSGSLGVALIAAIPGIVGAMLGAVCRGITESACTKINSRLANGEFWPKNWPVATFIVNCGGSFLLGLLTGIVEYHLAPTGSLGFYWGIITSFLIGFTGGFSTFSTAMVDALKPLATHVHTQRHNQKPVGWSMFTHDHCLIALAHIFCMAGLSILSALIGLVLASF